MAKETKLEAQNPLILRCQRIMECFAKSDDERDFYLDRQEGFIIYVDLDKPDPDIIVLEKELETNRDRYCLIPKLTFYETKKIMEGFVNEKVYDIDTKEKLLDIIQSKEARENFLEFIYDHHSEFEKWQQYYQERSRIRIIEWLRQNQFYFVFEEDLDFTRSLFEKVKRALFQQKVGKDILAARKILTAKAKTYYSNEALNPRPKRGRPPKQATKLEIEPQIITDIYISVPPAVTPFLFTPVVASSLTSIFSAKFDTDESLSKRHLLASDRDVVTGSIDQKLASLRELSNRWVSKDTQDKTTNGFDNLDDEDDDEVEQKPAAKAAKANDKSKAVKKAPPAKNAAKAKANDKSKAATSAKKPPAPAPSKAKKPVAAATTTSAPKKPVLRSIMQKKNNAKPPVKKPTKK